MNKPILYTGLYAIAIASLQYVLMSTLPNTGMGGMAVIYIIWPVLAASVVAVYWLMYRIQVGRLVPFLIMVVIVSVLQITVHPQENDMSFAD